MPVMQLTLIILGRCKNLVTEGLFAYVYMLLFTAENDL